MTEVDPVAYWRPKGPPAEGVCQAVTDDGPDTCMISPGWRITVPAQIIEGVMAGGPSRAPVLTQLSPSWLVCTPHLGQAIALADESYAGPLVVEVHHG